MVEFKHGKYIALEGRQDIPEPPWGGYLPPDTVSHVMYLDGTVIKGAPYMEFAWFWPTDKVGVESPRPHKHDFDEVLAFFGTNRDDPKDLGAEIELWIDDEPNVMNKSFVACIPAGTEHCPLNILKIWRPVFHVSCGHSSKYF